MENQVISGGDRLEMRVKEIFADMGVDADTLAVMMPLTTAVNVETSDNVIGFAWTYVDDPQSVNIMTFPGRDWEATAQYTGLSKDVYEQSLYDRAQSNDAFMNAVNCPVFAYAGGMLRKALKMVDIDPMVIEIPNAVRKVKGPLAVLDVKSIDTIKFVKWLNSGVPLRKMKRTDLATSIGAKWDDRSAISVIGRNLAIDAALASEILDSNIEFMKSEDDD